mgnify:CR=1 FL=1
MSLNLLNIQSIRSGTYLPALKATEDELKTNGFYEQSFFQNKVLANVVNITNAAACYGSLMDENQQQDYVGKWEDAFLFSGYENGKHSLLTSIIANAIERHGFTALTTCHYSQYRQPSIGENDIIVFLHWKGENVIPSTDKNGNQVRIGITDPRLYLPKVVQSLLDLEFGYDKELFGRETITRRIEIVK